jgi:hypothetical protein
MLRGEHSLELAAGDDVAPRNGKLRKQMLEHRIPLLLSISMWSEDQKTTFNAAWGAT